jgi:hypothetical protein
VRGGGSSAVYTCWAHCTYQDPVTCFQPSLFFKYNIIFCIEKPFLRLPQTFSIVCFFPFSLGHGLMKQLKYPFTSMANHVLLLIPLSDRMGTVCISFIQYFVWIKYFLKACFSSAYVKVYTIDLHIRTLMLRPLCCLWFLEWQLLSVKCSAVKKHYQSI